MHNTDSCHTRSYRQVAFVLALATGLLAWGRPVAAQEPAYKIGVVDLIRVLESSPQAERARAEIEKEFAPLENEVNGLREQLRKLEEKLSKEGAIMSEAERRRAERDVLAERRNLERKQDEYKDDLNFRKNEELTKIQRTIIEAIQTIAREENYDLILNRETLPYFDPQTDITERVLKKLSERPGVDQVEADNASREDEQ